MAALGRVATRHVTSLGSLSLAILRAARPPLGHRRLDGHKHLGIRFKSAKQREKARVQRERNHPLRLPPHLLKRAPLSFPQRKQTHLPTGNLKGPLFIARAQAPPPPTTTTTLDPEAEERLKKKREKEEIRERIREKAALRKEAKRKERGIPAMEDLIKTPRPSVLGDRQATLPIHQLPPTPSKTQLPPHIPDHQLYALPDGPLFTSEEICGRFDDPDSDHSQSGKLYGQSATAAGRCQPITEFTWNLFLMSAYSGKTWWSEKPIPMTLNQKHAGDRKYEKTLQFRPSGFPTRLDSVDHVFFNTYWNKTDALPVEADFHPEEASRRGPESWPAVNNNNSKQHGGFSFDRWRMPSRRCLECLGGSRRFNQRNLVAMPAELIIIRRRIEAFHPPMPTERFKHFVDAAVANPGPNNLKAVKAMLYSLVRTCALFDLIHTRQFVQSMDAVYNNLYSNMGLIEHYLPVSSRLQEHWSDWYALYYTGVGAQLRKWMRESVEYAQTQYQYAPDAVNRDRILDELNGIDAQIPGMEYPPEQSPPYHPPKNYPETTNYRALLT